MKSKRPSVDVRRRIAESAATRGDRVHIVSVGGKWAIRKEGASRATRVFDSKREALEAARKYKRNDKTRLIVSHNEDGRVVAME